MVQRRKIATKLGHMKGKPTRVVLIESNPADVRLIQSLLLDGRAEDEHFEIENVDRLAVALERLSRNGGGDFDIALLDLSLPDSDGLGTLMPICMAVPRLPIIVLTELNDEALASRAMQMGVQDYLVKGEFDGILLGRTVRYAIERHRLLADTE